MLTEIHRQALGSPVTRMATTVRMDSAYDLKLGTYGEGAASSSYVRSSIADSTQTLIEADQVLAGTHRTRRTCNATMREALGFHGDMPMPGEKIICKRNNKLLGLLNGSMWRVMECQRRGPDVFTATIQPWEGGEDTDAQEVNMHAEPFAGREVLPEDKFDANEFDWGYCITVHSAQGSQWTRVAVINDGWSGPDRFLDRWLYTAITRAQESVTIIKPQAKQAKQASPATRLGKPKGVTAAAPDFSGMKQRRLRDRR